jgi:ATP-dependent DNA helicase RecQ
MRRFVESATCRHRQICLHFGETPKWDRCDACDVCGVAPEWLALQPEKVAASRPRRAQKAPDMATPGSTGLRDALKQWRVTLAKQQSVPAYVILHDATIEALCRARPTSLSDLLEVPGIGERKAQRFGKQLLEIVAES